MVKNLPAMPETWVRSLGRVDPLERAIATHSSILAWSIPWTEEPGGLQSTGSQRVGHDWVTKTNTLRPTLQIWSNTDAAKAGFLVEMWSLDAPRLQHSDRQAGTGGLLKGDSPCKRWRAETAQLTPCTHASILRLSVTRSCFLCTETFWC